VLRRQPGGEDHFLLERVYLEHGRPHQSRPQVIETGERPFYHG